MFHLIQSEETPGDKNRHVLRKLHDVEDSDFERFLDHLEITQPKVYERINNVRTHVHVCRQSPGATSEDDFGSDFDPGITFNLSHLSLLTFLILTYFMDVSCQHTLDMQFNHISSRAIKA